MNCTQCHQPLKDGALYCEFCGHQHAVEEQKQKLKTARAKTRDVLAAQFHSPLFLVLTICYTVALAAQLGSLFAGGLAAILPFVFMLLSMIGMWKCYAATNASKLNSSSIRNASLFDAYTRVMFTISIVLSVIGTVFVVGLILLGGELLGELTKSDVPESGGAIVAVIFIVAMVIELIIIALYRLIYANRRKYFLELAVTAESGQYTAAKAPLFGSWFVGIFSLIGAVGTFFVSGIASSIFDTLMDYIENVGGDMK